MPILIPNPTRNNPNAKAVMPGRVLNNSGRFALTVSKSYFKLALPLTALPPMASSSAPSMVAAQAICIMKRNLLAAQTFCRLRYS